MDDLQLQSTRIGYGLAKYNLLGRGTGRCQMRTARVRLVLFLACFLAAAFSSQRFFNALSFAGLQVKRVTLYFFDYVLGLYLAFKTAKRILEGLTLLKSNFCQRTTPPYSSKQDSLVMASITLFSQAQCAIIFIDI
jgi:hypothetical protein